MTSNSSSVEETFRLSVMIVVNEGGGRGRVQRTPSHGFLLALISRSLSSKKALRAFLVVALYSLRSSGFRVAL